MSQRKSAAKAPAAAAPVAGKSATDDEKARYQKLIEAGSEKAPEKVRPYIKQAAPFIALAIVYIQIAIPYIVQGISMAKTLMDQIPEKLFWAIIGFCMCFFGGVFPATIAAVEAWSMCGGTEALENVKTLYAEFTKVSEANKVDNLKDEDGDGVPDANQVDSKQLLERKTALMLKSISPDNCSGAISGIYMGWIGVLATLKIKFAKTVTLGNAIGERFYSIAQIAEPSIAASVPEDYKKWVPVVLRWVCKTVAITIAWWVQRVISAFHSAIRGGLMFSRGVVNFLHERGTISFSDEDSQIDEYAGWALAAVGFLFQLWMGFGAPFPFNMLLWPVKIVEYFIIYSVGS